MPVVGQNMIVSSGVGLMLMNPQEGERSVKAMRISAGFMLFLDFLYLLFFTHFVPSRSTVVFNSMIAAPVSYITYFKIHFSKNRSFLIKGARKVFCVLDNILNSFSKVFTLTGFMTFKPDI
ncbi:hypothetical protein [Maridesulfovibrio zosterae]|uniref:hypothetical protein n=1 Tax=Maridesulfovibrio zosterae TaxID=82171 RepID=UPI0004871D67|nr:hypothetical protein [Maridesulfovibrio zosterae]